MGILGGACKSFHLIILGMQSQKQPISCDVIMHPDKIPFLNKFPTPLLSNISKPFLLLLCFLVSPILPLLFLASHQLIISQKFALKKKPKMVGTNSSDLPPGFRFHPTDEELIMYYLRNQAVSKPCPVSIIPEVDIYKFDPWELPEKTEFGENEWYFFTPRDRKYPNGVRPNRAAVSGYWKATGTDKSIYSGSKYVGVKKALVFYQGRPPKGVKTDWIMHEYRLSESSRSQSIKHHNNSMRLDDWVLCRIYKKKNLGRSMEIKEEDQSLSTETIASGDTIGSHELSQKFPRICSLSHLWEMEYMNATIPQIFGENSYMDQNVLITNNGNGNQGSTRQQQLGEVPYHHNQYGNGNGHNSMMMMNQPVYANPIFEFQS